MADVITPNEVEAALLTGVQIASVEDAKRAANVLHKSGCGNVIITLGALGALVSSMGVQQLLPACKVNPVDTTGAGDAFNGALAVALAEGKNLADAAHFANRAAALSVTKPGTAPAMPYRQEIASFNG